MATDKKDKNLEIIAVNCSKSDYVAFGIDRIPTLRLYTDSGKFVTYDKQKYGNMEEEDDILKFLKDNKLWFLYFFEKLFKTKI